MISPEKLRRFQYFSSLTYPQLKLIAAITEQHILNQGDLVFEECQEANRLCILENGQIDMYFSVTSDSPDLVKKNFYAGEVNPGDAFGISSTLPNKRYNTTARVSQKATILVIDAIALRKLMDNDNSIGYFIMMNTVRVAIERLFAIRVQLPH